MGKNKNNSSKLESKLDKLIDTIEKNEEKASKRHKDITKRLDNIEYDVEKCKKNDRSMIEEIAKLKASMNALEQAQLENFINIRGIQEVEVMESDLFDVVLELFQAISPAFAKHHVLKVQRIGKAREGQSRPIVAQLSLKSAKDALIESAKAAPLDCSILTVKSLAWGSKDQKIFMGHHLTRENSTIFFEARKLRKQGIIKYAWIKEGHVLIKKSETSKAIYLNRVEDIQTFIAKHKCRIFNSTKKDHNNSENFSDGSDGSEDSEQNSDDTDTEQQENETLRKKKPANQRAENKRVATSPVTSDQPMSQRPRRAINQKQH